MAPRNVSSGYRTEREPQRAYHGDYPSAPQAGARAGSRVSAGGEGGATRGTCAQYPKLGSRARGWPIRIAGYLSFSGPTWRGSLAPCPRGRSATGPTLGLCSIGVTETGALNGYLFLVANKFNSDPRTLRATSHTRLKALDHGNVRALIGQKGGDRPSSLHTRR